MYKYKCSNKRCKQEWTIRNKEEPPSVTCPKCGHSRGTKARKSQHKGNVGKPIDKNFSDDILL